MLNFEMIKSDHIHTMPKWWNTTAIATMTPNGRYGTL